MSIVAFEKTGYQLLVGDLAVMERAYPGFTFELLAEDRNFGNPVPVAQVIESLIRDGNLTTTVKYDNRVATFTLVIRATDARTLAQAEDVFLAEMDRPTTLTWQVPYGPPTVFDVVRSWTEFDSSRDLDEVLHLERRWLLSFECLPFVRSAETVTINYTGPATTVPLALAGWTVVGAGILQNYQPEISIPSHFGIRRSVNGALVIRRNVLMDHFLWFRMGGSLLTSVSINGTLLDNTKRRVEDVPFGSSAVYYTYDTSTYRGKTVEVEVTFTTSGGSGMDAMATMGYPNKSLDGRVVPNGIGVIDVLGSARARCVIEFSGSDGGKGTFLLTGPDLTRLIREFGRAEVTFSHFLAAGLPGYADGEWATTTAVSDGQPPELHPNGIWPELGMNATAGGPGATDDELNVSYPADLQVAVSYFPPGSTNAVVSASPASPGGYAPGALAHAEHVLHPGRCHVIVVNSEGEARPATFTYYPHYKHQAAR